MGVDFDGDIVRPSTLPRILSLTSLSQVSHVYKLFGEWRYPHYRARTTINLSHSEFTLKSSKTGLIASSEDFKANHTWTSYRGLF
ncbi:hypothetical protein AVEN_173682-1 [Araneus ventricosus]|uniref:Uncharacterized protein n=1 Tax=Araneus ventricosus TaxID=182803 RepID=A0A4Y2Q6H7_ARAVE|nr:hypothetical protein AVEN_173682-1 [Araneus ventricosus]